ncbi:MAG: T9SS type A sorting domain-containing protein [Saprospiraceae bacterium]|nr:T9SS type A sorting domain-containing protein [Saprospiraceae bacterium]
MKKNLLGLMAVAMACYVWFGNASGPGSEQGLDRTGSPISPGYCGVSSCHGGGNFNTSVSLLLLNADLDTISEYSPGEQYKLRISIAAVGAEGYGMQAVALKADNQGAGAFGDPVSGTRVININGNDYFEHTSTSNSSTFEIDWTAPESGTGDIRFFAAGNAVNRNFQPSGDQADTTSLLVSEGLSSSLHDRITLNADLKIYPSFASTEITSEWSSEVVAKNLTISDLTGKIYRREMFQAQSLPSLNIPVSDLPSSLYFVRLNTDKGLQTQKFIKL